MSLIKKKILGKMSGAGRGKKIYARSDFSHIGSRATVNRALKQLVDEGKVRKVGRGLYDFPRFSKLFNDAASVKIADIVDLIQRRDRVRLMPDGSVCANNLGLTNMAPARITYFTDGSSRTLVVDDRTIKLKRIGNKWMYWHGRRGRDVVLALKWLGQRNITDSVIKKLNELPDDVKRDLLNGLDAMPRWMADVVKRAVSSAS